MSSWFAMHRSDEARSLLAVHPNAFLLGCQIALRAKWKDCPITGLRIGESFIGDWKNAGLRSEMAYRVAKKTLLDSGLATFRGTNRGTIATLLNSAVFSLSQSVNNGQDALAISDKQQARNALVTTNYTDTKIHGNTNIQTTSAAAEFLEAWNASSLPKILKLTKSRQTALSSRLKDPFFQANWKAAIARADNSAFAKGSGPNGWTMSVDFFLKPDSLTKIMEGKYDDRDSNAGTSVTLNLGRRDRFAGTQEDIDIP